MDAVTVKRVKDFINSNPEYREYISGVGTDSNVIQIKNKKGKVANVTIDILESGRLDLNEFDKEEALYNYRTLSNGQKIKIIEEPKSLKPITESVSSKIDQEEDIEIMEEDFEPTPEISNMKRQNKTMSDLKDAINLKDIEKIDLMLVTDFKNPETGLIDMNNAVSTINENCVKQAADCIKDNKSFSQNLADYDLKGNSLKEQVKSENQIDPSLIKASAFMPVRIILTAAGLKGITYNLEEFQKQFNTSVDDRYRLITAVTSKPTVDSETKGDEEVLKQGKVNTLSLVQQKMQAGFADIFILTAIILVYAAIIINLILKMR